jgi:hypothetical protein
MAKMKRGRSLGPSGSELSNTLGSLFRTTLEQASVVREVFERGAKEGRARFDEVRSERKRGTALTELGEIVLDLVRRGEIDLVELPEIAGVVRELDAIDGELERSQSRSTDVDAQALRDAEREAQQEERRERVRRSQSPTFRHGNAASAAATDRRRENRSVPDIPARSPTATDPESLMAKLRREADGTLSALRDAGRSAETRRESRGGISFESEDDLAEYMHPNDVPDKK